MSLTITDVQITASTSNSVSLRITYNSNGSSNITRYFRAFANGGQVNWNVSVSIEGSVSTTVNVTAVGWDGTAITLNVQASSNNSSWGNHYTIANETMHSGTDSKSPDHYPYVTDQWVANDSSQADNCVAQSIASMMEVFEKRERGVTQSFSVSWIYGNRGSEQYKGDGMYVNEALDKMIWDGVPKWNQLYTYTGGFPDNRHYYDYTDNSGNFRKGAATLYSENVNAMIDEAQRFRISAYSRYTPRQSNIQSIKNDINNGRLGIIDLAIANNFYYFNLNGDYSIPKPDGFRNTYHTLLILGWTYMNSKLHWICHNNWGQEFGNNGICYMPVDYTGVRDYYTAADKATTSPTTPEPSSASPYFDSSFGSGGMMETSGGAIYLGLINKSAIGSSEITLVYSDEIGSHQGETNKSTHTGAGRDALTLIVSSTTKFGESYTFKTKSWNETLYTESSTSIGTTLPKSPTLSVSNSSTSNDARISVTITGMKGKWDDVYIELRNSSGTYISSRSFTGTKVADFTGLTAGHTYTVNAWTRITKNGTTLTSYFTRTATIAPQLNPRPTNFAWTNSKVSGANVNILKSEWDSLKSKVNEFRAYKNLSAKSWAYTATVGADFTANHFNEVRNAIADMSPPTSPPSTKVGISSNPSLADDLRASDLNGLLSSLNSIP